jgi:hypothetical protein
MRKTLLTLLLFVAAAGAIDPSRTRFEKISDEHFDPRYNHAAIFEVWHDKVSGQEFTCVSSRDTSETGGIDGKAWPLSCFPTGRVWK